MDTIHQPVTKEQAEEYGFVIETKVGFMFNCGCTIAILSYNSLDDVWQFDTAVDSDGNNFQFIEKDLNTAIAKGEEIAKMLEAYTRYLCTDGVTRKDIDFVGFLEVILAGCAGVNA